MTPPACPWPAKRVWSSQDDAIRATVEIQARVELQGQPYNALYPYLCPSGAHWHLSHYPQGTRWCDHCEDYVSAFCSNGDWVLGTHSGADGSPCLGINKKVSTP